MFRRRFILLAISVLLGGWTLRVSAAPIISEFMASNKGSIVDEDGSHSDWLEIFNPDDTAVSLSGWYLTDNSSKPTKWRLPEVILSPGEYLVVFASSKDRRDPTKTLHTNFDLSAGGEYLGLIRPDGVTVASEYAPSFPPQSTDVSYGLTQPTSPDETVKKGYFAVPTPGQRNGGDAALAIPAVVTFSRPAGTFAGRITLEMAGAGAGQRIRYLLQAPSARGATVPTPKASDPVYSGPITLDSSVIVIAQVFSADDSQHGPPTIAEFLQLSTSGDASLADFSSGLPVVVLDDHGAGDFVVGAPARDAWLHLFNAATVSLPNPLVNGTPALASPVTAKIRGFSSANFPKKSFNFTLLSSSGSDSTQTLLGLPAAADWALVSPWQYDRSYLRNAYVYTLGRLLGRWAPSTRFAEMFVNVGGDQLDAADYAGITVLVERVKVAANRVNITPLASTDVSGLEVTGGYILKIDDPSEDSYRWSTNRGIPTNPSTVLNVDSTKDDKLAPAQKDYIRNYVQSMEDALFADHAGGWVTRRYLDFIDVHSWIDYHLLNVFVLNVDGLQRSVYFTKDRGDKMKAGPLWDFDRCMGSADGRDADPTQGWGATGMADPWNIDWWGELAHDPDFFQAWVDRWQGLRRNELADGNLTGIAETLAQQIDRKAAARDAVRWPDDQSRYPGGVDGEIAHVKQWITARAAWIDQRFVALPGAEIDRQRFVVTPPEGTQLAYTLDGSDPRASGGGVATSAVLTSDPLVIDVAVSGGVRVRSYDPRLVDVFPGSPWSSSALVANLPVPSRLLNLSSRGYVGAGESVMLSGVVVRGTESKRFLARGIGPTLTKFGIDDAITQSSIRILASDGTIVSSNDGWAKSADAAELPAISSSVGAFALSSGSADAALIVDLAPGSYSLALSSGSSQAGVGMVELYELEPTVSRAVNLSARAYIEAGNKVLIGGLAIGGNSPKRVLVRAIGPTLKSFNIDQALSDPVLSVYNDAQVLVAQNDDWQNQTDGAADIAATTSAAGAFALPAGSRDAALVLTLAPGNYTLQVAGKAGGNGVGLLETYELPEK